jgi:protein-disulfide isomerase
MSKRARIERRKQQQAKQRRQLIIIGGVVVVALVILAVAVTLLNRRVDFPENIGESYASLEQGETDQGFPRLGSPTAPIIVEEFSSFGCVHCETLHEEQLQDEDVLQAIEDGQVQVIFYPITTIANTGNFAQNGARAALCAGEQNAFWAMSDIIFYWRTRYGLNDFRLEQAANELDLDTDAFMDCYGDNAAGDVIQLSQGRFNQAGYTGTPVVLVNGEEIPYTSLETTIRSQLGG